MELGRLGIWSGQFWGDRSTVQEAATELEALGYGALWFNNGSDIFELAKDLLKVTQHISVATGILNIWAHPAPEVAERQHELEVDTPGRFLLGLGVSHAHLVDKDEPGRYAKPLERMRAYLDELDSAPEPVPTDQRMLAALGPRMLTLSRERSIGAHPYLVTPEHTRFARGILGQGRLLAPEQAVVLETDPTQARDIARRHLARYMQAPNYTGNWIRLGFTADDLTDGGSDRLVDALVAWGDVDAIGRRIAEHLQAGADHVCIQVLTADSTSLPRAEWQALASLTRM